MISPIYACQANVTQLLCLYQPQSPLFLPQPASLGSLESEAATFGKNISQDLSRPGPQSPA